MTSRARPAYDAVAELYDRAFSDIRVRRVEWRWLTQHLSVLSHPPRVLDVGCGTGALLRALSPNIRTGTGIDVSDGMIEQAQARAPGFTNLSFMSGASPVLPFGDHSFEVVISFLSFRYLEWPDIWREIRRVVTPGGRFLMVDLAAESARVVDAPKLARAALRQLLAPLRAPDFVRDLRVLTSHADWHAMLARHPIRESAAYRAFFEGACPERKLEVLDATFSRRVIALDSGPLFR